MKKGINHPDVSWLKDSDLQPDQIKGLISMVEKFPQFTFTQEITPVTLEELQQNCKIDMDALEQSHGNDVSEHGELPVAEEWALNKAFYTELLGFPLILWDRRVMLKPSPYKRIFKRIHELAPNHRLKGLRVKTLYIERKKRLGCADMYSESSTKRRQWQDEMVRNLKEWATGLKREKNALLSDVRSQLDFMKPNRSHRSKKSKHKSRDATRSKTRLVEKNVSNRRRSLSVGMTAQEYSASFERMFHKKSTRENISATRDREAQKMNIKNKYDALTETNFTRAVDLPEAQYFINKPPYSTNPPLMLEYVALHTDLQQHKKMLKVFKHFFLQPVTQILFEDMYWYIFCKNFQPNSEKEQEHLLKSISAQYVAIVGKLSKKNKFPVYGELFFMTFHKDVVFTIFPFALARAVCVALHGLCNGSSQLFNSAFSQQVYADVYFILYGVPACDASIRNARTALFDKPTGDFGWSDATELVEASNSAAVPGRTGFNRSRVVLPSVLPNLTQLAGGSPILSSPKKHAYRLRQNRVRFSANMISPLVRRHLHTKRNQRSGSVDISITRTVPVLWCRSGGMDNHHKTRSRKHIYQELRKSFKSADAKYQKDTWDAKYVHNKEVHEVEKNLKQKLRQTSDIGRYCLDLMIAKQKKPSTSYDLLEGMVYDNNEDDDEEAQEGEEGKNDGDKKVAEGSSGGAKEDGDQRESTDDGADKEGS